MGPANPKLLRASRVPSGSIIALIAKQSRRDERDREETIKNTIFCYHKPHKNPVLTLILNDDRHELLCMLPSTREWCIQHIGS